MWRKALLVISLLAIAGSVGAQSKWKYQLGLGWNMNEGNVNNMSFNNTGSVDRNDSTLAFSANYKIVYDQQDKVETNKGFNAGIKFDLFQYDRWSPFFASEYINNKYKGYDYKLSLLLGAKYRIYTVPGVCDYSVSGALVYDHVKYCDTTGMRPQVFRASFRFKVKQKIGDVVSLNHSTFYQPSFYNFTGDYIITSTTKMENKLGKNFFLDLIFNYEYRSIIPVSVAHHHDIETSVALRWTF